MLQFRNLIFFIAFFIIISFATYCGPSYYNVKEEKFFKDYQSFAYDEAYNRINSVIEDARAEDINLLLLERAKISFAAGNYDNAIKDFQIAEKEFMDLEGTFSISEELTALWINDITARYKADVYEQLMINPYLTMCYIAKGEFDEAIIEKNRSLVRINQYLEKNDLLYLENPFARYLVAVMFEKENQEDDALIEYKKILKKFPYMEYVQDDIDRIENKNDNTNKAIIKDITNISKDMNKKELPKKIKENEKIKEKKDKENQESSENGIILKKKSKSDQKTINQKTENKTEKSKENKDNQGIELNKNKKSIKKSIKEEKNTNDFKKNTMNTSINNKLKKESNSNCELIIFVESGTAPYKYPVDFKGFFGDIWVSYSYAKYVKVQSQISGVQAFINNKTFNSHELYDLEKTIMDNYKEKEPSIKKRLTAKMALQITAQGAGKAMQKSDKAGIAAAGLLLDVAGKVSAVSDQADTRCWSTLPKRINLIRIRDLKKGKHNLILRLFSGKYSSFERRFNITLKNNEKRILYVCFPM